MEELTIQEVAARTGLSVHALRYYERIGLLDPIDRATSGHRRYTADDLNWIAFLMRLRATGMSIQQMQTFADLRRQGNTTAHERLAFLEAHQQQAREHQRELERHLVVIEEKIHHYKKMLTEKDLGAALDQVPAPYRFSMTKESKKEAEETTSFS